MNITGKWMISFACLMLFAGAALADGLPGRVNLYIRDGDSSPVHHSGPIFSDDYRPNPCFPYNCGEIIGPLRNPDPDARSPENLTACIYNATGTLLYEREGKVCPYKYVDANQLRIEQRKLEWFKQQRK